jgi:competence protein ComFC
MSNVNHFFASNPLTFLLDLLLPKFNINYSSCSQYLTQEEIKSYKPFKKDDLSQQNKNLLSDVWVCAKYQDLLLQDLILRAKIQGEFQIAEDLANLIQFHFQESLKTVDFITFVPPDPARFLTRGYHLPFKIAFSLSQEMGKKCISTLIKTKSTQTQTSLNKQERLKNLENAFEIDSDLEIDLDFKTILILDDVSTTGSTLAQCSKTIKKTFQAVDLKYLTVLG